jgi:hypothetical protein
MTLTDVLALIERHRDERGVAHWRRRFPDSPMRSLGVGLTVLRGLAKQIGRDHELAGRLWTEDLHEARVIGLLIDDPSRITRAQAEAQVEQLAGGQLAHVFSSCDASLAKVPFVRELADDWMVSPDPVRQGCGYGLLYEMSKESGKKAPDEAYFARWIDHVERAHPAATVGVRLAMATALMGIGKRSARLNRRALGVARDLGPVDWDPTGACEPFDAVKHIDHPRLRAKLGVEG